MRNWRNYFTARNVLVATGLFFLTALHLYLISKTFVIDPAGNFRTAVAGYGDIPLHLTQISKFAFSKITDFSDPIYAGVRLQYPFVLNLVSGLILKITSSWSLAVLGPVYLLAFANIILLFLIYRRLLSPLFAVLAIAIFLLGSGMGGYGYIKEAIQNHQSLGQFTNNLTINSLSTITKFDAVYPNQNIDFGAPLSLVLLHQRTFFLGLFGFLLVIFLLTKFWEQGKLKFAISAGIILGLLPLWHSHAFVAAFIFFAVMALFSYRNKSKNWPYLIYAGVLSLIIALPQFVYLMGTKNAFGATSNFVAFRLGWMVQPSIGSVNFPNDLGSIFSLAYAKFLWVNFGLILPLFILALILVFNKKTAQKISGKKLLYLRILAVSGTALFLAVLTVRFQPWDYDNNKLLVYFQVLAAVCIVYLAAKLFYWKKTLGIIGIIILSVGTLASGLIDVLPRVLTAKENLPVIFDTDARDLADYVSKNISEKDLILTSTTHLNPISSLLGREVLAGYPGWLWTRGIDYSEREQEIKNFYSSPSFSDPIIQKYNLKYILLDETAKGDFNANVQALETRFDKIFANDHYILFRIDKSVDKR